MVERSTSSSSPSCRWLTPGVFCRTSSAAYWTLVISAETSLSHTATWRCWARRTRLPVNVDSALGSSVLVGNFGVSSVLLRPEDRPEEAGQFLVCIQRKDVG